LGIKAKPCLKNNENKAKKVLDKRTQVAEFLPG
jgi:hypothetical protein